MMAIKLALNQQDIEMARSLERVARGSNQILRTHKC